MSGGPTWPLADYPIWMTPEDRDYLESRFEILTQAGQGGMGVVYRARHRALDIDVAIKVILDESTQPRFQREGKLLARVRSDNVVLVRDLDRLPSGRPLLIMDWVDGRDLGAEIENHGGSLAEKEALSLMRDTCRGMLAIEDEHIVHRDLKPSNILVDQDGAARVTDFGLARAEVMPQLTLTGDRLLGTPHYMAPEQAEYPAAADTRSDIYSFGATYYHVLTGQPPFRGRSIFEILFKHKMEPLVAPRAVGPEFSERSSEILEKCLAKSPDARFQSFRDILISLDAGDDDQSPWSEFNDPRFEPHRRRFLARRDLYCSEWNETKVLDTFEFEGGRRLEIVTGDITKQNVEAIVSSDDGGLRMGGGVSWAIRLAAGEEYEAEARVFTPVRPGRAVVTSAGRLPARFVFHGVTMGRHEDTYLDPSRDLINEIVRSCLYHCESLNVRSIAFPLLGTGTGGFSEEICLDVLFMNLARALLRGLTPLEDVRIVLYAGG